MPDVPATLHAEPATTEPADAHFVSLRVRDVVRETPDAISLVLDVPEASAQRFRYQAGQFLTLLVCVDGRELRRCYSMSSSPALGDDLRITVKRDGVVSNWLNDKAAPGSEVRAAPPQGRFLLEDTDRELVGFAGGSGITPVFSLLSSALASSERRTRLFYANRHRASVIFHDALSALAQRHPGRLTVQHHLDHERGVTTADHVAAFVSGVGDADFYICGPGPFMDTVEATLIGHGMPAHRLHLERFEVAAASLPAAPGGDAHATERVTIVLGRNTVTATYGKGDTLLQTARMAGLQAPSSCETGSCGTCMARITEGGARMLNNDALDADEVAEGWVLTCQAVPTSRTVRVVYE